MKTIKDYKTFRFWDWVKKIGKVFFIKDWVKY